jgi:hypothetical protein
VDEYLTKASLTDYDLAWVDRVNARAIIATAKNDTLATIEKGTPVYQTNTASNSFTIEVAPADAADPSKMPAIGVLGETLVSEAEGELIILGEIKGVNTNSFLLGDEVYVAVGGGYTNVAPTANNVEVQFLGIVTRVSEVNGAGYVLGTAVVDKIRYNATSMSFEGFNGTSYEPIVSSLSGASILENQIFS